MVYYFYLYFIYQKLFIDYFARLNVNFLDFIFHITKQSHSRPSTLKALEIFDNKTIRVIEIYYYTAVNSKEILIVLNVKAVVIFDPYEKIYQFS